MIVLGIDPGLANTGYGVIARRGPRFVALEDGVILTAAGLAPERRLAAIHARLTATIELHGCEAMALEELYFGQNARSAFAVGHARGVAMLAAGEQGIPCFSYTPQQVKSAVCGHGRADKEQVMRMVGTLLALDSPMRADHAADALAVALCHVNTVPFRRAVTEAGGPRAGAAERPAGAAERPAGAAGRPAGAAGRRTGATQLPAGAAGELAAR